MSIGAWMAWEGGVDLVGATADGLQMPNVLVHIGRLVHTPLGSAPSGMVLWQPDPKGAPVVVGYVCSDPRIGKYYGPNIFKGTPFEGAPVMEAKIEVKVDPPRGVGAKVQVAGHTFETWLSDLGPVETIHRAPGPMPFTQQGLEAKAGKATLKVDGKEIAIQVPPVAMSGGPGAVWAPCGMYAR